MQCKSCHTPLDPSSQACPVCGITKPFARAKKSKRLILIAAIIGFFVIIVIPMLATLLWMQSSK